MGFSPNRRFRSYYSNVISYRFLFLLLFRFISLSHSLAWTSKMEQYSCFFDQFENESWECARLQHVFRFWLWNLLTVWTIYREFSKLKSQGLLNDDTQWKWIFAIKDETKRERLEWTHNRLRRRTRTKKHSTENVFNPKILTQFSVSAPQSFTFNNKKCELWLKYFYCEQAA